MEVLSSEVYEVIAQGARYWFLGLMALIVWKCYRLHRREKRAFRRMRKRSPEIGFVGEMVVMDGGSVWEKNEVIPLSWEGVMGTSRTSDVIIPFDGVCKKHLWYRYDETDGTLHLHPMGKGSFTVDGRIIRGKQTGVMKHGSFLTLGGCTLRMRLFAGFEGEIVFDPPAQSVQPVMVPIPVMPVQPALQAPEAPAPQALEQGSQVPAVAEQVASQTAAPDYSAYMRPKSETEETQDIRFDAPERYDDPDLGGDHP